MPRTNLRVNRTRKARLKRPMVVRAVVRVSIEGKMIVKKRV